MIFCRKYLCISFFFLLVCTINGKLNLCAMLTISESKIINCITNLT